MILPITKIGSPLLRKKCSKLPENFFRDPKFHTLVKNMILTMRGARGVGLAANQVGRGIQVVVLECQSNRRYPGRKSFSLQIYANPRIVERSKKTVSDWEGCLSIPGYRGLVPRHKEVVLEALTPEGAKIKRRFAGFEARVIQHELDHLNGFFYIDRMKNLKSWMCLEEFNKKFRYHKVLQ